MYSKEEKQFMDLRSKFTDELSHVDKQIDELVVRRNELLSVLHGDVETGTPVLEAAAPVLEKPKTSTRKASPKKTSREQMVANVDKLVAFLKKNQGVGRRQIDPIFEGDNLSSDQIRRIVESAKKRGLIVSEGKSRSAKWYAVDGS